MNNMRRGFTMIELIFVIVIIGILAAVAIPKLQGVSEDAEVAKLQAYAGTLSRSIMPGIWSRSLRENNKGKVVGAYDAAIRRDLPALKDLVFTSSANEFSTNMESNTTYDFTSATTVSSKVVATENIGGQTYSLVCHDGSKYSAPECDIFDPISGTYMLGSKSKIN